MRADLKLDARSLLSAMAAQKREKGKRKNMSKPSHLRKAEENRKLEELQKLVQDFVGRLV